MSFWRCQVSPAGPTIVFGENKEYKRCVYCITSCFIYTACNGTEVMSSSNLGAISNDVNEVQFRRPQIMHMYS